MNYAFDCIHVALCYQSYKPVSNAFYFFFNCQFIKKNAISKVSSSSDESLKDSPGAKKNGTNNALSIAEERFAEFAVSVEIGLADYFTGP